MTLRDLTHLSRKMVCPLKQEPRIADNRPGPKYNPGVLIGLWFEERARLDPPEPPIPKRKPKAKNYCEQQREILQHFADYRKYQSECSHRFVKRVTNQDDYLTPCRKPNAPSRIVLQRSFTQSFHNKKL